MQRLRFWSILFLVPLLAGVLTVSGCSKKDEKKKDESAAKKDKDTDDEDKKDDEKDDTADKDKKGKKDEGEGDEAKTELKSTGWGTLKGKVTLDGDIPERKVIAQVKSHKDHLVCEMGDIRDQTWKVDKDTKGVADVVIWLRPPDGKYFKIQDKDKKRTDVVAVDQPHCAFIPHVSVAFPSYYNPKSDADNKQTKTGQKFEILNSAPITHNTRWKGDPLINPGKSETLPAKKGDKPTAIVLPLKADDKTPVSLNCDLHKWMSGKVWAFDHPYAAVTKEDGTYEIKNVPTGVKLYVVAWHEGKKFITDPAGEEMTLKKETEKDFTLKK